MQRPDGILFDLDGTLLDTARDLGNALNHVLARYKLPLCDYEQYRPVASHGSMGLLNLGFGDLIKEYDFESLRSEFLDFYNANLCVDTLPFDGVDQLITTLDQKDLPWGIVTNKPGWLTDALLPNFNQFKNCKVVISGDTLAERKPHPAPLLHAAEAINVEASSVWYIGDAERDIQAANAANMISVIADYGYISDSDRPEEWKADLNIKTATCLISYL